MRDQFIAVEDATTESEALDLCPWAAVIEPVEGGWHAWESVTDHQTWLNACTVTEEPAQVECYEVDWMPDEHGLTYVRDTDECGNAIVWVGSVHALIADQRVTGQILRQIGEGEDSYTEPTGASA